MGSQSSALEERTIKVERDRSRSMSPLPGYGNTGDGYVRSIEREEEDDKQFDGLPRVSEDAGDEESEDWPVDLPMFSSMASNNHRAGSRHIKLELSERKSSRIPHSRESLRQPSLPSSSHVQEDGGSQRRKKRRKARKRERIERKRAANPLEQENAMSEFNHDVLEDRGPEVAPGIVSGDIQRSVSKTKKNWRSKEPVVDENNEQNLPTPHATNYSASREPREDLGDAALENTKASLLRRLSSPYTRDVKGKWKATVDEDTAVPLILEITNSSKRKGTEKMRAEDEEAPEELPLHASDKPGPKRRRRGSNVGRKQRKRGEMRVSAEHAHDSEDAGTTEEPQRFSKYETTEHRPLEQHRTEPGADNLIGVGVAGSFETGFDTNRGAKITDSDNQMEMSPTVARAERQQARISRSADIETERIHGTILTPGPSTSSPDNDEVDFKPEEDSDEDESRADGDLPSRGEHTESVSSVLPDTRREVVEEDIPDYVSIGQSEGNVEAQIDFHATDNLPQVWTDSEDDNPHYYQSRRDPPSSDEDLFEGLSDRGDFEAADFNANSYHDDADREAHSHSTKSSTSGNERGVGHQTNHVQKTHEPTAALGLGEVETTLPADEEVVLADEGIGEQPVYGTGDDAPAVRATNNNRGDSYEMEVDAGQSSQVPEGFGSDAHAVSDDVHQPASSNSKTSRSRAKRVPKPSFFDRQAENSGAFAELPAQEAVNSAKKAMAQRKRTAKPAAADSFSSPANQLKKRKIATLMRGGTNEVESDAEKPPKKMPRTARVYVQGQLTEMEMKLISRAVEAFKEDYSMEQTAVNDLIQAKDPRYGDQLVKELWMRITDAVPNRRRQKVVNTCRTVYHNFVARGSWTKEQDDELTEMINIHGQKWSKIGQLINRHQNDCRYRWRDYLQCGGHRNVRHWTEEEEALLATLLAEALQMIQGMRRSTTPKDPRLKDKSDEDLIDWKFISSKMGYSRSAPQCREKYKRWRQNGLLSDEVTAMITPVPSWRRDKAAKAIRKFSPDDKFRLIRAIRESGVGRDDKVPWKGIADSEFKGRWDRLTLWLMWSRLRVAVPDQDKKTTRDCAAHLLNGWEEYKDYQDLLDDGPEDRVRPKGRGNQLATPGKGKQPEITSLSRGGTTPRKFIGRNRQAVEAISDSEEERNGARRGNAGSGRATGSLSDENDEDEIEDDDPDENIATPRRQRLPSVDLGIGPIQDAALASVERIPATLPTNVTVPTLSQRLRGPKRESQNAPAGPAASRKRLRTDSSSGFDLENFKTTKKAKTIKKGPTPVVLKTEPGGDGSGERQHDSYSSAWDDDMEDIPSRLPVAAGDG